MVLYLRFFFFYKRLLIFFLHKGSNLNDASKDPLNQISSNMQLGVNHYSYQAASVPYNMNRNENNINMLSYSNRNLMKKNNSKEQIMSSPFDDSSLHLQQQQQQPKQAFSSFGTNLNNYQKRTKVFYNKK